MMSKKRDVNPKIKNLIESFDKCVRFEYIRGLGERTVSGLGLVSHKSWGYRGKEKPSHKWQEANLVYPEKGNFCHLEISFTMNSIPNGDDLYDAWSFFRQISAGLSRIYKSKPSFLLYPMDRLGKGTQWFFICQWFLSQETREYMDFIRQTSCLGNGLGLEKVNLIPEHFHIEV